MATPVASAVAAEPEPPGMASGAADEVFGPGSEVVTRAVTGTVGSTFAGNDATDVRSPTGAGTLGPVPEEQPSGTGRTSRDVAGEPFCRVTG
ncbi:MAG TPA: hypothetical protein VFX70_13625 [Mycobacteriales bacterium]|nr:hypothetical protein [Mycobacteriales bacterium]